MVKKVIEIDPKKKKLIQKEPDFKFLYTNKNFQHLIK